MLDAKETAVILIDVQERLAPAMWRKDRLLDALARLLDGASVLELPVLATEHVPEKLGPTCPELATRMPPGHTRVRKESFSCFGEPGFRRRLAELGRHSLLVCGIESHVCVYQTAVDLIEAGFSVEAVSDAVSSRRRENRDLGLRRIEAAGGRVTGVEMALLEMTRTAGGDLFRRMLPVVR